MKKTIILSLFLVFLFLTSNAKTIIFRYYPINQSCEGFSSTITDYTLANGDILRVINCECSSTCEVCPSSIAPGGDPGNLDENDILAANSLFSQADVEINQGTNSGSITLNVQVSGENFVRHYTATWSINSSNQVEMTLDRNDY
ncbi:MAG: hypothetical protein IT243_01185 [Bacteroidia bacterium]|nr:hypothetical protein [Bacteroidia bacterium]